MCLIDDAELLDFCFTRQRKARKSHQCSECDRTILKKETYTYSTFGVDGSVDSNKCCSHCKVAAAWLSAYCGGFCFGGIKEDLIEHYDSGCQKDGLQSLVIGIRQRWRALGEEDLLPVPQLIQREIATVEGVG